MKTLKFHFLHPVKGIAFLVNGNKRRKLAIDSRMQNHFEISVEDCKDGKWQVILNWEFDGRLFTYKKEFLIKFRQIYDPI